MKKSLLFVVMAFVVGMTVNGQDLQTTMAMGPFDQVTTSINEASEVALVSYPNPVIDMVNIEDSKDLGSVTIYNMVGKLVRTYEVQGNSTTIDISDYDKGVYIIATETKTLRIVKQ